MKNEFIIRKIRNDELHLLEDIIIDALSIRNYTNSEMARMMDRLVIDEELIEKSIIYVIELRNKIIGFWLREIKEELSEGRFFILKDYMKKGFGTLLWDKMIFDLKYQYKLKYLHLSVMKQQEVFMKKWVQ